MKNLHFHVSALSTVVCFLSAVPALVCSQEVNVTVQSHQSTAAPPESRFEIVQSTLAAKFTFRLDKWTGRVWQLVQTKSNGNAWEELEVMSRPKLDTPSRARFQIFTSGLAARHTFLIDTVAGKTWVIVTAKRKNDDGTDYEVVLWEPFEE